MENNKAHNKTVLKELKPGHIVKFDRGPYAHYGIYTGNENIVHLAPDDNHTPSGPQQLLSPCGFNSNKAKVSEDNFWKVAKNSRASINNKADEKYEPFPAKEIISRAKSKVGQSGYNVCFNNCEHFATESRYGVATSDQVSTAVGYAAAAVIAAGVAYVGYKAWQYFRGEKNENN